MKKAIFASIAVAMLTACSNDEVVLENNDANAIRFGVTAQNNSRAADVFCNNNLPNKFNVWASYDNAFYIQGDEIGKTADNKWVNNSGLRYWPNAGDVTFYGFVNDNGKFTWDDAKNAPTFTAFEVEADVADQVDLLYARKTQAKKAAEGEAAVTTPQQVNLNFRHALSQIVFNAKNTNPNLYVEIEGVSICNVSGKGNYTLPSVDTDNNIPCDEATDDEATYQKATRGAWSALSDLAEYSVEFGAVKLNGSEDAEAEDLTTANDEGKEFSSLAMLLIPQETEAIATDQAFEGQTGSYFLVKCLIKNVAGTEVAENDVILWGKTTEGENPEFTGETANVLIPVDLNWEEGKKYTYTFIFGKGNGGFDPDPKDPTPDPVLVPITFNVKVDQFIPVIPSTEIETGKLNSNE